MRRSINRYERKGVEVREKVEVEFRVSGRVSGMWRIRMMFL